MRIKIPEAIVIDEQGRVFGYVTEVNDAYGHQVFCYDAQGICKFSFKASEARDRGWKNSFEVAVWFGEELKKKEGQNGRQTDG